MATMRGPSSPNEPSPTSLSSRSPPASQPLPPINTAGSNARPTNANRRLSSYAARRLSAFSLSSNNAASRSRPQSSVFPLFHSSLPYALVRDFAYPAFHPLHYGPGPEAPSGLSTPASEVQRRLSDPPLSWEGNSRGVWSTNQWVPPESASSFFNYGGPQLPSTAFERFERGDGPPYSEDEDLHSPVVTSTRHKKHKSSSHESDRSRRRSRDNDRRRTSYHGTNGEGGRGYRNEDRGAHVPYASGTGSESRQDSAYSSNTHSQPYPYNRRYPSSPPSPTHLQHSATFPRHDPYYLPHGQPNANSPFIISPGTSSSSGIEEESRYSRDYSFTIASPDEEMHGKAIALFDFERENENELPLHEGQVILVSYRHGQGWLVAQDPLSGESGLVPEEYVRLLRDIEGGWMGLMGAGADGQAQLADGDDPLQPDTDELLSPYDIVTPTQTRHHERNLSNVSNLGSLTPERTSTSSAADAASRSGVYAPVVSTFSTSRQDFEPHHSTGSLGSAGGGGGGVRVSASSNAPILKIPGNLPGGVYKPNGDVGATATAATAGAGNAEGGSVRTSTASAGGKA